MKPVYACICVRIHLHLYIFVFIHPHAFTHSSLHACCIPMTFSRTFYSRKTKQPPEVSIYKNIYIYIYIYIYKHRLVFQSSKGLWWRRGGLKRGCVEVGGCIITPTNISINSMCMCVCVCSIIVCIALTIQIV